MRGVGVLQYRPAAGAGLERDYALELQQSQRLAERGPARLILLEHGPLGHEQVAWLEPALDDVAHDSPGHQHRGLLRTLPVAGQGQAWGSNRHQRPISSPGIGVRDPGPRE